MKKNQQFSAELAAQYAQNKRLDQPKIILHTCDNYENETFFCHYAGGTLHLKAESSIAAVYGLQQLEMGIKSGHQAECEGEWTPRFPLRPLWIGCGHDIELTSRVGISLPVALLQIEDGSLDRFCRRLLELGYNSVIFGSHENAFRPQSKPQFVAAGSIKPQLDLMHDYGLKVILKPHFHISSPQCSQDPSYIAAIRQCLKDLLQELPSIDFVFWEASVKHSDSHQSLLMRDATYYDLIKAEAKIVEESLQGKASLIFYASSYDHQTAERQTAWLSELCDDVGDKTIIAFSAVCGLPWADHLPPHPFWKELRRSPDCSATPLMPIVNIGCVHQGEGLWPTLTLDLVEKYYQRCERHRFAGVIGLANQLPAKGAMLECNLWVASQALWKPNSATLSAETWFQAQRPDLDFTSFADQLKEIRMLAIDLSFVRSLQAERRRDAISGDERRALADSVWARLRRLQTAFDIGEKTGAKHSERPTHAEYFMYFLVDARRILTSFIRNFHISLPHVRCEEDAQPGFWTRHSHDSAMLNFLEQPQKGQPGTRMAQIFSENRCA